jgi:dynactin complex subunit
MDNNQEHFAIGYLRVPDLRDVDDIQERISVLREYCEANEMRLPFVVSEEEKGSENFKGNGWNDIEKTLEHAEGRIQSIVVLYSNMLTRDIGLQMLKERELKDKFGVKIEFADGHRKELVQPKNLSLN